MHRRAILISILLAAAAAAAAGAQPTEKKKGGGESYIQLPSLTATVLRADRSYGVMSVDIGIDVPDSTLRKRAEASIPLLRDAFLREMLIYAPSIPPGGPPNPDQMAVQLQRAADRTLGRAGAHVLLGTILIN
jgi:hypothetical protein